MGDYEMAYKYQYNPAATDNVSLHDNSRGRAAAGSLTYSRSSHRTRHSDDDETSLGTKCCFGFLFFAAQILLHGVITLILFWICAYRWDPEYATPFIWQGETNQELEMTWNLHPVLMSTGLIYFLGQGMLVYRTGSCCRRIYTKLIHSMFHLLAVPCIALGFIAVWDYKSLRTNPIPHFYSIHSWLGLGAMGLFTLQLLVGLFSFLALLACESGTAVFRAGLVPIHAIMGTATFIMALATAICGLMERAFLSYSTNYTSWLDRFDVTLDNVLSNVDVSGPLFLNVISGTMGLLAILMPVILWYPRFRFRSQIA